MEGGGDDGRRPPLPPGFRFRPTDEELLTHYLAPKVADAGFAPAALPLREVDLYKAEPWDLLPAGGGEDGGGGGGGGYFFCRRTVKFPSGLRTNRATRAGYWKSTGKDRVVTASTGGGRSSSRGGDDDDDRPLGVRKTLVFYRGRAPTGHKTSWAMHEYRLLHGHGGCTPSPVHATAGAQSEWVICRMFRKKAPAGETIQPEQEVVLHPPLDDHMQPPVVGSGGKTPVSASDTDQHANCFSNNISAMVPVGDDSSVVDGVESMLQLNRHGHEEFWMSYPESTTYPPVETSTTSGSAQRAALRLRDELATDSCFDLLPPLLDYDEAVPFLQDF